MTRRFGSLLRQTVGRIKIYMAMFYLTLGITAVSLGFSLLTTSATGSALSYASMAVVVLGLGFIGAANVQTHKEERKDDAKFVAMFETTKDSSESLTTEMKAMRQDMAQLIAEMRKDRDERDNRKPTNRN